jgi:hypothetical protein
MRLGSFCHSLKGRFGSLAPGGRQKMGAGPSTGGGAAAEAARASRPRRAISEASMPRGRGGDFVGGFFSGTLPTSGTVSVE